MGEQSAAVGVALRGVVAHFAIDFVLTLDKKLRKTTPVATGHARRNWISSVTEPYTGEVDDDGARAAGIASVLRYTLELGPMWLANNAPYVQRLNDGWSDQEPAGFIERAIDQTIQEMEAKWASKGIDLSELRNQFATRHQFADVGASPDAADTTSGGGEY